MNIFRIAETIFKSKNNGPKNGLNIKISEKNFGQDFSGKKFKCKSESSIENCYKTSTSTNCLYKLYKQPLQNFILSKFSIDVQTPIL